MPTANTDASVLTKAKRDMALYSWKAQQTAQVNAGGTNVLAEQSSYQSGQIVTQRNVGCMVCNEITATPTSVIINYPFRGSGGGGPTSGASPGQ
jgi:hypothetical protein